MTVDSLIAAVGGQLEHGIVVVDAAGRVQYANDPARELGSIEDHWQGRRLADACRDYRVLRVAETCLQTGRVARRDLPDVHLDRRVTVTAVPVVERGEEFACLLIRDDSRALRVETMRRDFVANVSHELRTPLTAIGLLVETLQKGALNEDETAEDFVGKIGLEVRHMVQMVEELLELSTIESGRRPLVFAESSLDEVLRGIDRLRPLAKERGVTLDLSSEGELPPLRVDAPRLSQAIRNLVHNALKFTPSGGSVTVTAALNRARKAVEITVVDTGLGIDPQDVPRIFERFWKADRSRGRDGEGSGLGLAIVRHIVEGHGGHISVRSAPRKGATFTVTLPLRARRAPARRPSQPTAAR